MRTDGYAPWGAGFDPAIHVDVLNKSGHNEEAR
jgi:hypothetical protein